MRASLRPTVWPRCWRKAQVGLSAAVLLRAGSRRCDVKASAVNSRYARGRLVELVCSHRQAQRQTLNRWIRAVRVDSDVGACRGSPTLRPQSPSASYFPHLSPIPQVGTILHHIPFTGMYIRSATDRGQGRYPCAEMSLDGRLAYTVLVSLNLMYVSKQWPTVHYMDSVKYKAVGLLFYEKILNLILIVIKKKRNKKNISQCRVCALEPVKL